MGCVFDEVFCADMEGKAFGEEVCKDCKFVGGGIIEPVSSFLLLVGGFGHSFGVVILLHVDHANDFFKHSIFNVSNFGNITSQGCLKNNFISISICGSETFAVYLSALLSSSLYLVDVSDKASHGLGHGGLEALVEG